MSIPKKGSRPIIVDDHPFRWRVRHRPTYCQGLGWTPLVLAVESADISGSTLLAAMTQLHPSNWLQLPSSPVLPSQVADYIREAISLGWKPTQHGKPFRLKPSHSETTLADG